MNVIPLQETHGAVSWLSKTQAAVSLSTAEAEFAALNTAPHEI